MYIITAWSLVKFNGLAVKFLSMKREFLFRETWLNSHARGINMDDGRSMWSAFLYAALSTITILIDGTDMASRK